MKWKVLFYLLLFFSLRANAQSYVVASNIVKNDSIKCLQNISVYREFKKMNLHEKAISEWSKVYIHCPSIKKLIYQDGAKFLLQDIKMAKDINTRKLLVDSLMHLYDKRIQYFGEKAYVNGRKGLDLYLYDKDRISEAYHLLAQSAVELNNETKLSVIKALVAASAEMYQKQMLPLKNFIEDFLFCTGLLNEKLQSVNDSKKQLKIHQTEKFIRSSFRNAVKNNCSGIEDILNEKIKQAPENIDTLKTVSYALQASACTECKLFYQTALKIDALQADAQNAYWLAEIELKNGNPLKAEQYFKKAIRLEKSKNLKAKYLMDLAVMQYSILNKYPEAQKSFEEALKYAKNPAKTYYLIAEMYAAYSKTIEKKNLEYYSMIWLSIDYFLKAKESNPKYSPKVNKKLAYYRTQLPDKEDVFFYGLKAGTSYHIGGWINKQATVRHL